MMNVSDDRWTCPGCAHTMVANPLWQRAHRVAWVRAVRDLHVCRPLDAPPRRVVP